MTHYKNSKFDDVFQEEASRTQTTTDYAVAGALTLIGRRVLLPRQVSVYSEGVVPRKAATYIAWQLFMRNVTDTLSGDGTTQLKVRKGSNTPDARSWIVQQRSDGIAGFTGNQQQQINMRGATLQRLEDLAMDGAWDPCLDTLRPGIIPTSGWSTAEDIHNWMHPKWYCNVSEEQVVAFRQLLDADPSQEHQLALKECYNIDSKKWEWLYELEHWHPLTTSCPGRCLSKSLVTAVSAQLPWLYDKVYIGGNGLTFAQDNEWILDHDIPDRFKPILEQDMGLDCLNKLSGWKTPTVRFLSPYASTFEFKSWQDSLWIRPAMEQAYRIINKLPNASL